MTTTHKPLRFYPGDTWEIMVACHGDAGEPLDLTDATIVWTLYSAPGVVALTKTLGAGVEVFGAAANGKALVTVSAVESALLPAGSYFDETRVTADGEVSTQAVGAITVASFVPEVPATGLAALKAELAILKAARRTGAREIEIGGQRVQYRSDGELRAAIAATEQEIAAAEGPTRPANVVIRSVKGW